MYFQLYLIRCICASDAVDSKQCVHKGVNQIVYTFRTTIVFLGSSCRIYVILQLVLCILNCLWHKFCLWDLSSLFTLCISRNLNTTTSQSVTVTATAETNIVFFLHFPLYFSLSLSVKSKCGPTFFACANGVHCIIGRFQCNGFRDCPDGSDEDNCSEYPMLSLSQLCLIYKWAQNHQPWF